MVQESSFPIIRPALPGEAQLISDLALRSKGHWSYDIAFLAACREELTYSAELIAKGSMQFFVLELNRKIVGFYALDARQETQIELEALFVEPTYIGRGYGRLLIEHAKQRATATGATEMIIQGDPYAAAFYRAAGGVLTGERESDSIPGRYLPTFSVPLTPRRSD
jgi:GNAT superfamily N-acetyltransferase